MADVAQVWKRICFARRERCRAFKNTSQGSFLEIQHPEFSTKLDAIFLEYCIWIVNLIDSYPHIQILSEDFQPVIMQSFTQRDLNPQLYIKAWNLNERIAAEFVQYALKFWL